MNVEVFERAARAISMACVPACSRPRRDLADPIAGFEGDGDAPEADRAIIADRLWQAAYSVNGEKRSPRRGRLA